jgi:hypothetical protein
VDQLEVRGNVSSMAEVSEYDSGAWLLEDLRPGPHEWPGNVQRIETEIAQLSKELGGITFSARYTTVKGSNDLIARVEFWTESEDLAQAWRARKEGQARPEGTG